MVNWGDHPSWDKPRNSITVNRRGRREGGRGRREGATTKRKRPAKQRKGEGKSPTRADRLRQPKKKAQKGFLGARQARGQARNPRR